VKVAVIVLAAGASRRLGRPKQLLPLGGEPLIRHTVRNALAARASEVVVVLGNQADAIEQAIGPLGQRVVFNPDFADGQSTSMVAGIRALPADTDAAMIVLGDQPTVSPALLDALIDQYERANAAIVQPRYQGGIPGNPVLLAAPLFPELLAVSGDLGAREVIRAHRSEIVFVDTDAPVPPDVDDEGDYAALTTLWESLHPSTS
jgi:molybdenum cofactor cytidylyltransferase